MSERRPVGLGTAFVAELRFLAQRRWPLILLLVVGAFAVNWLVRDENGGLFYVMRVDELRAWVALAWASAIWAGERPSQREYFLAEPTSAARHEIARVLAGAVYLTAANAAMVLGEQLRALPFSPATMGPAYAVAALVGPLILYLLVAGIGLASAWPVAWFLVGYLAIGALAMLRGSWAAGAHEVYYGKTGFGTAIMPVGYVNPPGQPEGSMPVPLKTSWIAPQWRTWAPGAVIWLTLVVLALLLFAHRRALAERVRRWRRTLRRPARPTGAGV